MDKDMGYFESTPLVNTRLARTIYPVTYDKADLAKFPQNKYI